MKPLLLKVNYGPAQSFSVRSDMQPNINNRWHYHDELELIQFHRGSGTQFIGDRISRFSAGDIVLVGSNLPHYWRFDEASTDDGPDETPYSTVIHFFNDFMGKQFLSLPETRQLSHLLERAARGIYLPSGSSPAVSEYIREVYRSEHLGRLVALINCLGAIASADEQVSLASIGFKADFPPGEHARINAIYNYTLTNFHQRILLDDVAAVAGMVPNSFCRYFKSRTGQTYMAFVTGIRVGFACKLLLDNKLTVKQICFESGFDNFSCFHKKFKEATHKTPQQYQREYLM